MVTVLWYFPNPHLGTPLSQERWHLVNVVLQVHVVSEWLWWQLATASSVRKILEADWGYVHKSYKEKVCSLYYFCTEKKINSLIPGFG